MRKLFLVITVFSIVFIICTSAVTINDSNRNFNYSAVSSNPNFIRDLNASYPSYLFLNNFVNSTIWVYTGIEDPYLPVSGCPEISDISLGSNVSDLRLFLNTGNESIYSTLLMNNSIIMKQDRATEYLIFPPNSDDFLVSQISYSAFQDVLNFSSNISYKISNNEICINTLPRIYIFTTDSQIYVSNSSSLTSIHVEFQSGYSSLEGSIGGSFYAPPSSLVTTNNISISKWLGSSVETELPSDLQSEYNMSLLVVKDDQNPYNGEFVASPSPLYLYAWVRDGSFSAISMLESGHYRSALKYFRWMMTEQGKECVNGAWETRFNFWTGAPDLSWVHPEFDSVGEYQMGIYYLYDYTHNLSLIYPFLHSLNESLKWEEDNITQVGLLPQDYSIWEDQYAYNFWTQSVDDVGMNYTIHLYMDMHLNTANIQKNESKLTQNILKYFTVRDGTMFAEFDTSAIGDPNMPFAPYDIYDSSTILPIALGFINPDSSLAKSVVSHTIKNLTINGGLARFYGDTYHYTGSPSDSSGQMPPWIITTMFEAYYDEITGNHTGALDALDWAANHSQSGLLPEAVDPNFGNPLPTTSPLTWSSAMFVIVSVHYDREQNKSNAAYYVAGYTVVAIVASVSIYLYIYNRRKKSTLKE